MNELFKFNFQLSLSLIIAYKMKLPSLNLPKNKGNKITFTSAMATTAKSSDKF